jgi:hypothetical protein
MPCSEENHTQEENCESLKTKNMQHLELQKMGLMELQQEECGQVNGGSIWKFVFRELMTHFDEFSAGLKEGWNY